MGILPPIGQPSFKESLIKESADKRNIRFLEESLRTFPKVFSGYAYKGEEGINPAYCDIDACQVLCLNETRIWALRSDGILATGIKNVCVSEGSTDLFQKVDKTMHRYLDRKNRYGHPTLAMPDKEYDGSVHYAGWLCQRSDHLQIFMQSGRFRTETILTDEQREALEVYIAYKFLQTYKQEKVLFYDRIGEELLTSFLAGPFDSDRPCRVYTREIIEKKLRRFEELSYEKVMATAQKNMYLSVEKLISEGALPKDFSMTQLTEVWEEIKKCFNEAIYLNRENDTEVKHRLKESIRKLIRQGVPFVDGKDLALWSTKFARYEAEKYSKANHCTTDGMAQEVLRKILVGWPDGQLNVLFHAVKNPAPYPKLTKLFWAAMSEVFMEELPKNREVHIFFQDKLAIGNFCWDYELPIAREKQAKIFFHRYDPKSDLWESPVSLDSLHANHIIIKRRNVHESEIYDSHEMEMKDGLIVWKQEFENGAIDRKLTRWASPEVLTLGKLRVMARKMIKNTLLSRAKRLEKGE